MPIVTCPAYPRWRKSDLEIIADRLDKIEEELEALKRKVYNIEDDLKDEPDD